MSTPTVEQVSNTEDATVKIASMLETIQTNKSLSLEDQYLHIGHRCTPETTWTPEILLHLNACLNYLKVSDLLKPFVQAEQFCIHSVRKNGRRFFTDIIGSLGKDAHDEYSRLFLITLVSADHSGKYEVAGLAPGIYVHIHAVSWCSQSSAIDIHDMVHNHVPVDPNAEGCEIDETSASGLLESAVEKEQSVE